MQAWAGIAIAQLALLAFSLRWSWRACRVPPAAEQADAGASSSAAGPLRAIWWPGIAILVTALLAAMVFVGDGGRWSVLAAFGTFVLATDVVLLRGALVTSLCTRARAA